MWKIRRSVVSGRVGIVAGVAVVLLGWSAVLRAQEATDTPVPSPAPAAAIDVAEIAERASGLRRELDRVVPRELDSGAVEAAADEIPAIETEIETLRLHLADALTEPASLRVLRDERVAWGLLRARLGTLDDRLTQLARELSRGRTRIGSLREEWSATLEAVVRRGDPPVVVRQVEEALDTLARAEELLGQRLDPVLDALARVGALRREVTTAIDTIDRRLKAFGTDLLRPDSPPAWRLVTETAAHPFRHEPLGATVQGRLAGVGRYVLSRGGAVAVQLAVWLVLGAWLASVGRRLGEVAADGRAFENVVAATPFTASLLMAIAVGIPLHAGAPRGWRELLYVVVLAALTRLAVVALPRRTLGAVAALAVFGALHWIAYIIPDVHPADRWLWLVVSALGAVAVPPLARRVLPALGGGSDRWSALGSRLPRFVSLVLGASVAANLAGLVDLAVLVTGGLMISLYNGAVLWMLVRIFDGVVGIALRTGGAGRSRVLRDHGEKVRGVLRRSLGLVAAAVWAVGTLNAFLLGSSVVWLARHVLEAGFTVGSLTVSLGSLLAAVVTVWIAVLVSRVLRFFFEEEVTSRVALPPGVPATMSRLIHYAVVVLGVVVALAAAGIGVGQLAIVLGALGVGIGFGLQNIVNNFISGLILMFEGPIRIGDVVQLGTLSGVVTSIGIRASTVRTWDGSEVVVPNGNLISNELINWTLSDASRRLELPVGVAYGTDPERVIELLVATMKAHGRVLAEPEPFALFIRFGESSLDFSARCWCAFDDSLRVASDLHVGFHRALAEAGIQIPFPQRDLHLRTADAGLRVTGTSGGE